MASGVQELAEEGRFKRACGIGCRCGEQNISIYVASTGGGWRSRQPVPQHGVHHWAMLQKARRHDQSLTSIALAVGPLSCGA
jgi:hypothetical protein